MSANLRIGSNDQGHSVWMPSSGAFDQIMDGIQDHINESEVTNLIQLSIVPGSFGNLINLSEGQFRTFHHALEEAFTHKLYKYVFGKRHERIFEFCQLKALVRLDARTVSYTAHKRIAIDSKLQWEADKWVYDLLLESLIAHIDLDELRHQLWDSASEEKAFASLIDVSGKELEEIQKASAYLTEYFAPVDKGRIAFAHSFNPIVSKKFAEFNSLVKNKHKS